MNEASEWWAWTWGLVLSFHSRFILANQNSPYVAFWSLRFYHWMLIWVDLGHEVLKGDWYCEGCRSNSLGSSNPYRSNNDITESTDWRTFTRFWADRLLLRKEPPLMSVYLTYFGYLQYFLFFLEENCSEYLRAVFGHRGVLRVCVLVRIQHCK